MPPASNGSGYDGWLDLVAVSHDGTLGAHCICWLDPVSRSGLFEPVGTRPVCHGLGLGKAVISEGPRRLRDLGAGIALVTSIQGNDASAGFGVVDTEHPYFKRL